MGYASLIGLTLAGSKRHKGMSSIETDLAVFAKTFFEFLLTFKQFVFCVYETARETDQT